MNVDAKPSSLRVRTVIGLLFGVVSGLFISTSARSGMWQDNFDSGDLRDYEIFNLDRAVEGWDLKDGTVVGEIFAPHAYSLLILKPRGKRPENWTDYSVRVRAKLLDTKKKDVEPRLGLSLYDQEFEGNRYLTLVAPNLNELHIVRVTNDVWQIIPFAFPVPQDEWIELTATIETMEDVESVTFQVNDGPELRIRAASPLRAGKVGLVVRDAVVAFDDLVIEGETIPNGGRGVVRPVSPRGRAAVRWAELKAR